MGIYENIYFEKDSGIGVITISRPRQLNALNGATLKELDRLVDEIGEDESVKVIIITGSGNKSFVAGADIAEMQFMTAIEGRKCAQLGQQVFSKIEKLDRPVIAAVNGFALGGGCELSMACDIRIAAENAKFGLPEVTLGILPGFGGTQRLARLIGKGQAMELLFTGEMIDAAEAYRIGLVNKVVPQEELMGAVKLMAQKIMSRSPLGVRLCKGAVNTGMDAGLVAGLAYESEVFGLCFATADQKEGMAAFIEKRKAEFSGK